MARRFSAGGAVGCGLHHHKAAAEHSMAIECRHCRGAGTCSTGENGNSCDSCAEMARESPFPFVKKKITSTSGLPCGCCKGYGDIEARSWQLQSAVTPAMGLIIVAIVLVIIMFVALSSPAHHGEILSCWNRTPTRSFGERSSLTSAGGRPRKTAINSTRSSPARRIWRRVPAPRR